MRPSQIRPFSISLMVAALSCASASAHERPTTTPAARFLQDTIGTAFDLVRPPVGAKADADLDSLIHESMDWDGLTQFAIGRYRADLDDTGMNGVEQRLAQQLESLARRAGIELPTMTLAIRDMEVDPEGNRHVHSTATVPRFGEVEVEWTLIPAPSPGGGNDYRIADIKAFGLTLRQFLRNWIAGLIAARSGDAVAAFEPADPSVALDTPAATSPQ